MSEAEREVGVGRRSGAGLRGDGGRRTDDAEHLALEDSVSPLTQFYVDCVDSLGERLRELDLGQRGEFHRAMWLVMALGANQTAFAERHGYQPHTVSRWVNGAKAPPPLRRAPIVRDAYAFLLETLQARPPVPKQVFTEADPPRASIAVRRAGRPVLR